MPVSSPIPSSCFSHRPAGDPGVAEQLRRLCDPWVKHFRDDLEHDRETLKAVPEGTAFIGVARRCGTDLVVLRMASDPAFPPMGKTVPFLFGEADREKIADAVLVVLELNEEQHRETRRHWFAHWGKGVVQGVRPEEAMREARAWREGLQRGWDRERRQARG